MAFTIGIAIALSLVVTYVEPGFLFWGCHKTLAFISGAFQSKNTDWASGNNFR